MKKRTTNKRPPNVASATLAETAGSARSTHTYKKTVTQTPDGSLHEWNRNDGNGNKCRIVILNPTAAHLEVINRFTS